MYKPVGWTMYDCRFSPINAWPPPSRHAPNYWQSHHFPFPMHPSIPRVYLCLCTEPLGIHLNRFRIVSMQSMTWSNSPNELSLCRIKNERKKIYEKIVFFFFKYFREYFVDLPKKSAVFHVINDFLSFITLSHVACPALCVCLHVIKLT